MIRLHWWRPVSDGAPLLGADALPDTAQICSCNNVSKGDLCAAIDGGAQTVGDLKACTKASATCGGCSALVKQVLDSELEKRGVEVNNHICEHFAYSRQEIYHLVRVGQITTFDELLEKHGSGDGCDICKADRGQRAGFLLERLGAQQTPCRAAGHQRLLPGQHAARRHLFHRAARGGGEITPDKLIVLGEVAKQYDLYTKITGGQRVDLFGARVEQLPEIWKILVDAGFETGHAYGKSLRTVKSCVGSTWCRYGVKDSVGTAIQVEDRYRACVARTRWR